MKVISGGQTGADRGGLLAALDLGLPIWGFCPKGRKAEDGVIPAVFTLEETNETDYGSRTEMNVLMADATLIVHQGRYGGGTSLTLKLCERWKRPTAFVNLNRLGDTLIWRWNENVDVKTLNVAGPRESHSPGLQEATRAFVRELLRGL